MSSEKNVFAALWKFKGFRVFVISFISLIVLSGLTIFVMANVLSKDNINNPKIDHLHFRMQYVYHGEKVNLADAKYQQPYEKNQCGAAITESPIHLHDDVDQIVHIHWRNITGGQVLKYYGVNKIGGLDNIMGFRFDKLKNKPPEFSTVTAFKNPLPKPENDDKLFVYSGDKGDFKKREVSDWLSQTVETFFGQKSQLSGATGPNLLGGIEVKAETSDTNVSSDSKSAPTEEELKAINNFIGNVVIFVQKEEPADDQVNERFNNLQPLPLSSCGG